MRRKYTKIVGQQVFYTRETNSLNNYIRTPVDVYLKQLTSEGILKSIST